MTITLTLLATIAWLTTWALVSLRLRDRFQGQVAKHRQRLVIAWSIALLLHGLTVITPLFHATVVAINFATASSIVMWLSSALLFVTMLFRPLEALGLFVFPFTIAAMLLPLWDPEQGRSIDLSSGLGIHIFTSLLAYSMLTLAALQALLLAMQNKHLHNHHPGGLIRTLPPLQDMEALLFKLLFVGIALLSAGLISGALYVDNLFSQHLVHKTVLSIIAWGTFSTLLFGHWRYGWRGRIAIRWTLTGFVLLMLAFFGSKFVLEFLVKPQ